MIPGAVSRLQQAWSSTFFVVEQLLEAPTHAGRAKIVLQLSDAVITAKAEEIQEACRQAGFASGSDYIAVRLAHHCAKREEDGTLPRPAQEQLEFWRLRLVAIAEFQG